MHVQVGVLLIQTSIAFLPFSLPSPSSLLKLPIFHLRQVLRWRIRIRQVTPLNLRMEQF